MDTTSDLAGRVQQALRDPEALHEQVESVTLDVCGVDGSAYGCYGRDDAARPWYYTSEARIFVALSLVIGLALVVYTLAQYAIPKAQDFMANHSAFH